MTMTRRRPQPTVTLVTADAPPPSPALLTATVAAVTEDSLFLRLHDGRAEPGWRTAGCLLEPSDGDLVLCTEIDGAIAILTVLRRAGGGEAAVSVPGAASMALTQDVLAVRTGELEVDAASVTVRSASSRLLGKAVTVIADGLETVANTLRRVVQQDISSAVDSVRVVENTDTLKARHLTYEAGQTMALRSHVTVIDASGDVRVNGERISLG